MRDGLAFSVLTFTSFFVHSLVRLAIPLLLTYLETPVIYIGGVMIAQSITIAVLSVPLGRASDTLGRRKLALLGTLFMLGGSLAFIAAVDLLAILAASVFFSVGWAALEPSIASIVGDRAAHGMVGRSYGTFAATLQAGNGAGPAAAGLLISLHGYAAPFILSSVIALGSLIWLTLVFKETSNVKGENPEEFLKIFRSLARSSTVPSGWVAICCSFAIIGAFDAFFPVYATRIGLEPWLIGALFSGQFIVGMITRVPLGIFLDKIGDKLRIMALGLLASAMGVALIPLFVHPLILFSLMLFMSTARALTNIGGMTLVALGTSKTERGLGLGIAATFRHTGFSLGPAVFTLGVTLGSFLFGFFSTALIAVPGSVLLLAFRRRSMGRSRRSISNNSPPIGKK